MIKIFFFILLTFITVSCSFNENSKIWNNKKNFPNNNQNIKKIYIDNKKIVNELNPFIKLNLSDSKIYNDNLKSSKYSGNLNEVASYKFSKFNNLKKTDYKPLFLKDGLIFFDKKGSIFKYNYKKNIIWKKNYYSKYEKKIGPKLNLAFKNNNLIVADNVAKIYLLDITNGDLVWSINNTYPINSEIKVHKDKFFLIDYENTLRCYYVKDGSDCWSLQTENTFTISNSKNSLIIHNDLVIFNNSIGDITAVDTLTGLIEWQLPTQDNKIINRTYNFEISELVKDKDFIYFSNNKNKFYSVNMKNGTIHWTNKINSTMSPILIGDYIFTISNEGYLFTIQKNLGNIIRINDIYKIYDKKKKSKVKPIGFTVADNNLFLTSNDGKIMMIELMTGNIVKFQKISKNVISKPFIHNENLFVIKNGSIIQYN